MTHSGILRRIGAALFVAAYLLATAGFLVLHALGDFRFGPLGYFFTWDMFPHPYTQTARRVALGRTESGRYVQLGPSPCEQYRGGVHSDLTRLDLDRRALFFRQTVDRTVAATTSQLAADPVRRVWLCEAWWPAKYNYPPDVYEAWAGTSRPDRRYWRTIGEYDVETVQPGSHAAGAAP